MKSLYQSRQATVLGGCQMVLPSLHQDRQATMAGGWCWCLDRLPLQEVIDGATFHVLDKTGCGAGRMLDGSTVLVPG